MMKQLTLLICFVTLAIVNVYAQEAGPSNIKDQAVQIRSGILGGPPQFILIGKIETGKNEAFAINGQDFKVNDKTRITGVLEKGAQARAQGERLGSTFLAKTVVISDGEQQDIKKPDFTDPKDFGEETRSPGILPGQTELPR
ncbi:MAG: hypothetical protein H6619_00070 [Deltaproteobacteria bacterium]|nr:hypothetical protein [Deltaproteobacteria bacterium]